MWNLSKTILSPRRPCIFSNFSTKYQLMRESSANISNETSKKTSIYKNVGVFHSNSLLAQHLRENIVFNDSQKSGLVAINKPFGLSLFPGETDAVSLTCALPELASSLNVPNITVIKSCGKFISGCTLLNAGGEKTLSHVTKCMNRTRTLRKLSTKYLAITNGIPRTTGVLETVDVSLEVIKTKKSLKGGDFKEPVVHRDLVSQTKLRKGKQFGKARDIKSVQMNRISGVADIVAKSRGNLTALVSIQPTDIQWNFICAYMADLLSPTIGDSQFSYRVQTILGKPVKVSHQNSPIGYNSSSLPRSVLGQLGITERDEGHLPVHVHHFRTHLPGFFGNEDLTIYAPIPKYFECSANSLEISLDSDKLESCDIILKHCLPKQKTWWKNVKK